jgi:hypothetical protein
VPLYGLTEIVWPPICGVHVLHLERAQTPGERRLAVRHGLGHVLAGHLSDLAVRHDRDDPFGFEETIADLFALMDLIPTRQLAELYAAGYSFAELEHWTTCELRRYALRWSDERIRDRVRLRLEVP